MSPGACHWQRTPRHTTQTCTTLSRTYESVSPDLQHLLTFLINLYPTYSSTPLCRRLYYLICTVRRTKLSICIVSLDHIIVNISALYLPRDLGCPILIPTIVFFHVSWYLSQNLWSTSPVFVSCWGTNIYFYYSSGS